ncbi:MAG TPA: hypothetical protein VJ867_15100 [Gemmatimonadaceae bacterium]|nr:hypothetical protein [Gemmatimonadaceae bacterium]
MVGRHALHAAAALIPLVAVRLAAQTPTPLPPITTSAPAVDAEAGALPDFEARRAKAAGRFITREQLRKEEERTLTDVLRAHLSGIAFQYGATGMYAYNPTQQPPGALNASASNAGRTPCYVQLVVDGTTIYQQSSGSAAADTPPDMSEYAPRTLDGVEYYSSPSRTPAEFRTNGASCGTLVLWTRRR